MILNLTVEKRTLGKKSDLNTLRRTGFIPAVIYAEGKEGTNVTVPANEFKKMYKKSIGEIAIFNLNLDGKDVHTVVKEKQIHPLTREVIHVDFLELHPGKEISIEIPVKFIGTPVSVKDGGILEITKRKLHAHCMPKFIPEDFPMDISSLKIGQTIYCKDVKIENVKITEPADLAIVSVHAPRSNEKQEETNE